MRVKQLQQFQFLRGQFFDGLASFELKRFRVDGRGTYLERRITPSSGGRARLGAAEQGVDARQQLADAERFGDVIVRAEVEADDFVDLLALGREHEDGRGDLSGAEFLADVVAAFAGQHHVEHDEGGPMFRDGIDGLISAIADGDLKPIAPQHFLQTQQDVRVVFHNQYFCFHAIHLQ